MIKHLSIISVLLVCIFSVNYLPAQPYQVKDDYLVINAGAGVPLYTTYTASMERSRLYGDKGYKMVYDDGYSPLNYGSEFGGRFFAIWEINSVVVDHTGDFYVKPTVKASFPDMAILEYQPWPGLEVREVFFVYSSRVALVECYLTNSSDKSLKINIYPVFQGADSLQIISYQKGENAYILNHYETKKRLISNLADKYPYPKELRDIFTGRFSAYSHGGYRGDMQDFYQKIKTDFYSDERSDSLNLLDSGYVDFVSLHGRFSLEPGESIGLRYCRGIQGRDEEQADLEEEIQTALQSDIQSFIDINTALFSHIPRILSGSPEKKAIYLSAFNLARGCMLPPSGETSYNFYAFSREPLWGWGHGHQVLHESLSMLSYVYLDPVSAQNSQRVYMEQQGDDGLIAYRHGPRGAQTYPHKGFPTTSAPFYNWINWEIYKVSQDREFLRDAYESGVKYTEWLIKNRDTDQDGTFEWGPYGIIENVRDWYNAVFQVSAERFLDVDKEDISDELECLDLSLMMVKEMRCLAEMAAELNLKFESGNWEKKADKLSELINERM